jgi:hypothetical protein
VKNRLEEKQVDGTIVHFWRELSNRKNARATFGFEFEHVRRWRPLGQYSQTNSRSCRYSLPTESVIKKPTGQNSSKAQAQRDIEREQVASTTEASNKEIPGNMQEFNLLKRHGGCTGMFWRPDPTGKVALASNNDWPRDDAVLRGEVAEVKGEKWLLVTEVKQKGKDWVKAPAGAAMPFEYNNHYYLN